MYPYVQKDMFPWYFLSLKNVKIGHVLHHISDILLLVASLIVETKAPHLHRALFFLRSKLRLLLGFPPFAAACPSGRQVAAASSGLC